MATLEVSFLHNQLEERKRRLEAAIVGHRETRGWVDCCAKWIRRSIAWPKGATVCARSATTRWSRTACWPIRWCATVSTT